MMATGWTLPRVGGCHLKLPDTRLVILCKMGDMYVVFSPVLLHWKISMQKCGCTERLFRHYVRLLSFEEIVLDESFRPSDWHTHASRAIDRWPKNKIKRVAFEFQFSPSKREKHPWRWTDCTNLHLFTSADIFRRLRGKSIFNIYQFLSENCFLVTPLKPKIKISVTLSINHPDLVSRIRVVG